MSQQINLYEARLRPRREWLTGRRLGVSLVLLVAALAVWCVVERTAAERSAAEFARVQAELGASQQKLAAQAKALAERKVPAALKAQIDEARAHLASRTAAMALLDSGQLGNDTGFSSVMRGFSHLASNALWLTGFSVGSGGQEIEIRGRLLEAGSLPAYVQRLAGEPAFKGMRFAALDMQGEAAAKAPEQSPANSGLAGRPAGVAAAAATAPRMLDFVLRSENGGAAQTAGAARK